MKTILEINEPDFEREVLNSKQPVLVNFWADWSQPCRRLGSVLEEVASACNGKAKVVKVNADNNPNLGMSYWIQSIPTLLYFTNGEVRERIVEEQKTYSPLATGVWIFAPYLLIGLL